MARRMLEETPGASDLDDFGRQLQQRVATIEAEHRRAEARAVAEHRRAAARAITKAQEECIAAKLEDQKAAHEAKKARIEAEKARLDNEKARLDKELEEEEREYQRKMEKKKEKLTEKSMDIVSQPLQERLSPPQSSSNPSLWAGGAGDERAATTPDGSQPHAKAVTPQGSSRAPSRRSQRQPKFRFPSGINLNDPSDGGEQSYQLSRNKKQRTSLRRTSWSRDATISFDEVYQNGRPLSWYNIVSLDNVWYILRCDQHPDLSLGHNGKDPLCGARRHLWVHNVKGSNENVIKILAVRVLDCDAAKAKLNNDLDPSINHTQDSEHTDGNNPQKNFRYEDVYMSGKYSIHEHPEDSGRFYVFRCEEHDKDFRSKSSKPISAQRHLRRTTLHNVSGVMTNVVQYFGFRVLGCDAAKAQANNARHDRHSEPDPDETDVDESSEGEGSNTPSHSEQPKSIARPSKPKVSHRAFFTCGDPRPGQMLRAAIPNETSKEHVVMILPTVPGDLQEIGLSGNIADISVLRSRIPGSYKLDRQTNRILGWADGYQNKGKNTHQRSYPCLFFDDGMKLPTQGLCNFSEGFFFWESLRNLRWFDWDDKACQQLHGYKTAKDFKLRFLTPQEPEIICLLGEHASSGAQSPRGAETTNDLPCSDNTPLTGQSGLPANAHRHETASGTELSTTDNNGNDKGMDIDNVINDHMDMDNDSDGSMGMDMDTEDGQPKDPASGLVREFWAPPLRDPTHEPIPDVDSFVLFSSSPTPNVDPGRHGSVRAHLLNGVFGASEGKFE
ncbi:hypothetical protein B0H63DRAFT_560876 [Podospora didyma]|uniref:Uncharacterized protein n=1 Tax=Podospora didyma TaxID=330526 RepID=A0AAE0TVQ9_9PEZI|nr:hypothetical protein B0H63DRAFT_560876 [Podospora didyma]